MSRRKYTDGQTVYGVDVDTPVRSDGSLNVVEYEHGDPSKYDTEPPSGRLPSMGSKRDSCGADWKYFCTGCGSPHDSGFVCNRSLCPHCWAYWCMNQATTQTAKLEQKRAQLMENEYGGKNYDNDHIRFHHMIVGFAPGHDNVQFDCNDTYNAMIDIADALLSAVGTDYHGGIFKYHSKTGEEGEDDRGKWKNRIGEDTDEDEVENGLTERAHVHCLVLAHEFDGLLCENAYNKTGLMVKRAVSTKEDNNTSIYGLTELASASAYSQSHVDLDDSGNKVRARTTWKGDVRGTEPSDATEARANAEVRKVAQETLGVAFSDHTCHRELDEEEETAGYGSQGFSGTVSGDSPSDEEKDGTNVCYGRTVDIRKAPKFLQDDEWCEKAPYASQLKSTWKEWKDYHPVDNPPPPD